MKKARGVIANIILICVCLAYLFPIYIIVVNAFKNRAELYENVLAFPSQFSFQYFAKAMDKMDFFNALKNCDVSFYYDYCCFGINVCMDACSYRE